MASAPISSLNHKEFDELPKENFWDVADIFKWEGFWYGFHQIESIKAFQSHFQACDDDVILASFLKTGTTWLKALCVSIIGRQSSHHQQLGGDEEEEEKDLLVRNISHFYVPWRSRFTKMLHILICLNLKMPHKILFIKYEDLKSNPMLQVKKLASFLGKPFEEGDEEEIEKVIRRCSFERLKNLDVNQNGAICRVPNSFLFRMGTVGDWKNHFTPEMSQRLDQIALMKLQNAGLDLEMNV
ncbi:hypothetical protein P3X46_019168 [Hevea brasiliensis]|uniref:Sulfotransferase n=1 Tax=Hevea brasiliensis TaxID=3981 RepID=A0ABQ9LUB8_HEVBR|nr:hypothetical protein P3X46_019168 [Hevea brasiliensis]